MSSKTNEPNNILHYPNTCDMYKEAVVKNTKEIIDLKTTIRVLSRIIAEANNE